ncbi:MAG: fimbrillin family protein [Muribaculaceae bacterium]|nr:fimbrillin family protein [Muribaculaceae bacterium]
MTGRLLAGMLAGLGVMQLVASCSADGIHGLEVVDQSLITFNAVAAKNASRGDVTTTVTIRDFVVTAYANGKILMDHVTVSRDGAQWTYSPAAYWPDVPVNFYAVSPADMVDSPDITGAGTGTASIEGYNNPGNVDLLYAVNYGEIQTGSPVVINFRHALSKVDVMLSSANSEIVVKVKNVKIGNVCSQGSFYYPRQTTAADNAVSGYWHSQTLIGDVTLLSSDEGLVLTPDVADVSENEQGKDIDFFIPQELGALSYDASDKVFTGAYIAVDCEIFDKATGGKLFPGTHTPDYILVPGTDCGRIMYPASGKSVTEWKIGYSYVYDIKIDNPAVLFDGIEFGVTVDEFADGNASESPSM